MRGARYDEPLRQLINQADSVDADPSQHPVPSDPDDAKVLATAVAAGAATIVTNDHHLLQLDPYGDIRIMRPKDFVASQLPDAD